MNWILNDLELLLPRYLSETTREGLIQSLRQFPDNIDARLYLSSSRSESVDTILQGDGVRDMSFYSFPKKGLYTAPCIVISNSCDISQENERHTPVNICYAPIINLEKYRAELIRQYGNEKADGIIQSIRKQETTQYFYLPKMGPKFDYEGILFGVTAH